MTVEPKDELDQPRPVQRKAIQESHQKASKDRGNATHGSPVAPRVQLGVRNLGNTCLQEDVNENRQKNSRMLERK